MNTTDKEKVAEKAIKETKIFDIFFPDNIGYKKITTKKMQLAGVDYEIYLPNGETVYIDLKTGIGPDYSMKPADFVEERRIIGRMPAVAVELYQYDIFTNTKGKLTDYFLYYIQDNFGAAFYLFDYDTIRNVSVEHKKKVVIENGKGKEVISGKYTPYTSFNGTGIYIKVPVEGFALKKFILTK